MPFSSAAGKDFIRAYIHKNKPTKVLDVGAGAGSLRKRYQTNGQEWHAIEIWQPYIDKYKLDEKYRSVVCADARTYDFGEDTYDVAFAGDVLEHMTHNEAGELMAKLRRAARTVIVSIPIGYYPQGEYEGNPYEKHITDNWSTNDVEYVLGQYNYSDLQQLSETQQLGTFIYERQRAQLKIAVYAISKNEEKFARRCVESCRAADLFVLADTGSTDRTVEEALDVSAIDVVAHTITISPWRFDLARNAALALIPADVDVCISIDLDEVMEPGWRDEIERLWVKGSTNRMRYKFDWSNGIVFFCEKIHARSGYHWHHACHEYPRPDPRIIEKYVSTDKLLISHLPDHTKSRGSYLDLLYVSVQEDPHCQRNALYYGRELIFNERWDDAIFELNRYLALPKAVWINERCYAYRLLAQAYVALGRKELAEASLHKATAETPHTREPWGAWADYHYAKHSWFECYAATAKALSITTRELVYTTDPKYWGAHLHDLHALSAYNIKSYDIAVEHGMIAVSLSPDDTRLQKNLDYYKEALDKSAVTEVGHASTGNE